MAISSALLASAATAAAAAPAATAASTSGTASAVGNVALQQLGSNFNSFLNLLMTQLQNQDPTQPMDTNQFTTELVQFTGVQQQVATNSSLSQLIALQQTQSTLEAGQLVGKQATVTANEVALQGGQAEVQFQASAGQPVAIGIVDQTGAPLRSVVLAATQGTNTWTWNGQTDSGTQLADGAYRVSVQTVSSTGAPTALPFSVVGTTTGVGSNGGTTVLDIGALSVPLTALQSLSGG